MRVLVLPRMEVQVESTDSPIAIDDVVHVHGWMPDRDAGHPLVPDSEQFAGDFEQALEDLPERAGRPEALRVKVEILRAREFGIEVRVPRLQRGRVRHVLLLAGNQNLGVLLRPFLRGGADLREEVADALRESDHFVLYDVVREALVSEDPREFVARGHELGQRCKVRGMAAVQVLPLEAPPDLRILGISENGDDVRVLRRDRDPAVGSRRMRLHEIGRQAREVRRSVDLDRTLVLADRAVEVLPGRGHLVPESLDPLAGRGVSVDPGQTEVPEDLADRVLRLGILLRHTEVDERVIERAVQGEVRREPLRLLIPLVRGLADRGIRVDVEQESTLALKFRESGKEAVIRHEEVLDGPRTAACEYLLETLAGFRQARGGLFGQGLRVGREQVPRGRERTRVRSTVSLRRRSARGHGESEWLAG